MTCTCRPSRNGPLTMTHTHRRRRPLLAAGYSPLFREAEAQCDRRGLAGTRSGAGAHGRRIASAGRVGALSVGWRQSKKHRALVLVEFSSYRRLMMTDVDGLSLLVS